MIAAVRIAAVRLPPYDQGLWARLSLYARLSLCAQLAFYASNRMFDETGNKRFVADSFKENVHFVFGVA